MSFNDSVYSSVISGGKQALELERGMEEAKVRPRELEAATSLAESRATIARSQIDQMTRLSQADAKAAEAIREANLVGDEGKTLEARMKAHAEAGNLETVIDMQEKIKKNKIDSYDALVKANKANEASNEGLSVTLRNLSDYPAALEFGEASFKKLQEEVSTNPTPENRAKAANTASIISKLRLAQSQGRSWQETKKSVIDPLADSLSTTAQNAKKVAEEGKTERAILAANAAMDRALLKANLDAQKLAADRDKRDLGNQTRRDIEMVKLDQAHSKMEQRLNSEIDKIITEQGEEVTNPESHFYNTEPSKIPNPALAAKKEQLAALRVRHDENLVGLQEAINASKTFVPKPYDKGLVLEKPKASTYSPEQELWIDKAMKANPGLSREAIIDQGKKLKKL